MHLLYCDESGNTHDPKQSHFILAGISVFERQGFWLANELDKIAARFDQADPGSVEIHGSPMLSGKSRWRQFPLIDRQQAFHDSLAVLAQSHPTNRIFVCVIKKAAISPKDPVLTAFEHLAS